MAGSFSVNGINIILHVVSKAETSEASFTSFSSVSTCLPSSILSSMLRIRALSVIHPSALV